MCSRDVLFRFAGTFVLVSALLAWLVNPLWLFFTAFVGANLLQTSFTNFCPLERILGAVRLFGCTPSAARPVEVQR
jgi:hypothetical protein